MRRSPHLRLLPFAFAFLAGCSASYPTAPGAPPPLADIQISAQISRLTPGTTASLRLFTIDTDRVYQFADPAAVTWFTSNTAVMRPQTSAGVFVATGPGSASLYASYRGFTDHIDVNVDPIGFPYLTISLLSGAATAFLVTSSSSSSQPVTTFSSSRPDILEVTSSGVMTAKQPGHVTITGRAANLTATYVYTVSPVS